MDSEVMQVLKDHGIYSINSEKFQFENHENDNRIIFYFNSILADDVRFSSTKILGYNEHPAVYEREDSIAVMFEDSSGREFWCHIPKNLFDYMNIKRIFQLND